MPFQQMSPEEQAAQLELEAKIAAEQEEVRRQRNEERARIRQERLYSRRRGR